MQQDLLPRRRGGGLGFLFLLTEALDQVDQREHHPGDDQEVDDDGEEAAPRQHRALLLRLGQRVGGDLARQSDEVVAEIESAGDRADDRHENVADQRRHDAAEGRADDDADREIEGIALDGEVLEFLQHVSLPWPPTT